MQLQTRKKNWISSYIQDISTKLQNMDDPTHASSNNLFE